MNTICLDEIGVISGGGVNKHFNPNEVPVRLLNYLDVYHKTFIRSRDLSMVVSADNAHVRRCRIKKGDIFFTPSSEIRSDIGRCAVAVEDIPDAVYSYHVVRLRPRPHSGLDLRFSAYAFATEEFLSQASRLCQGSGTRYVVTLPQFRSMTITLPPLCEQQAIAATLAKLDDGIQTLEVLTQKMHAVRQSLMQQLLGDRMALAKPIAPLVSGDSL